ncbi:receptor-like protein 9b [Gossypium arboreum]|nr:receptor-like protein 9b [Gossypium arboreum]
MLAQSDSLRFLRLSNNHLSGKITPTIFRSSSLELLYLDGNNFDGNIPSIGISTIPWYSLKDMDLSNNNLSGELPRWIWNVSNLNALAVSNNQLKGLIPMELCYLDSLNILDLSKHNFSGPIPSCFDAQSIKHLHLSKNRLSGTLKNAFFNSSSLVTLDLSENQLTGEIPYRIGALSALSVLLLKANYFIGEIPIEICKLYSLSIIDLSQNKLFGSIPSCLSHLTLKPNDKKSSTKTYGDGLPVIVKGANYFGLTEFEWSTLRGVESFYVDLVIEN